MKTKVIKINLEIKQDLEYDKYYEFPTYRLKKVPDTFDVETEFNILREQVISSSVDGKIISTSSKIIFDSQSFSSPQEEITINYE